MKNLFGRKLICMSLCFILLFGAIPLVSAATAFTDVAEGSWYSEAVDYVFENKLMNGTSETKFSPKNSMTRAMFVTVVYRIAGCPEYNEKSPFTDLKEDSWYEDAVHWGYETGVIKGTSDDTFTPNGEITRSQIVVFLWRYAESLGHDVWKFIDLSEYLDERSLSDNWVAFSWAVDAGIINGITDTVNDVTGLWLRPSFTATRAQCATIIQRFIEWECATDVEDKQQ